MAEPKHTAFNPNKVAYYEKAGREAYYDCNWTLACRLMVQLNLQARQIHIRVVK